MATDDLKALLKRHEAFWTGEGEEALISVTPHSSLKGSGGIPLADGSRAAEGQFITPDLIDPRRFYGEDKGRRSAVSGDFLGGAGPPHLCWTEAIVGCPVRVVTGGPWAEPSERDWTDIDGLRPDESWLEKLDEFVDFLAERAGGRYPIVQPLMRGPVDMMASAVGHEAMCVALMDAPETSEAFLSVCADFFVEAAKRRLAHSPPFEGGYLSGYGIWAPGSVVRTQLDNSALISPAVYREQVREHDRRIMEAFDYPLIHVHSGCLHIIEALLDIDVLKAIQVSVDYPGGPLIPEILPILKRIVQEKPLILTGPVTEVDLEDLKALSPQGRLCLRAQLIQS